MYVSIDCGQVEAFSALLERGASLTPPKSRLPALHCAASLGHVALVQRLVAHGLSVNAQDALGDTPLHCAALAQQVRVVRALLALGANRSIRNAKQLRACDVARTPLLQALLSEDGVPASPPADKCEPGALAQRLDDGKCPAHTLSAEGEVYVLQRLLSCTPHARELVHVRDKVRSAALLPCRVLSALCSMDGLPCTWRAPPPLCARSWTRAQTYTPETRCACAVRLSCSQLLAAHVFLGWVDATLAVPPRKPYGRGEGAASAWRRGGG